MRSLGYFPKAFGTGSVRLNDFENQNHSLTDLTLNEYIGHYGQILKNKMGIIRERSIKYLLAISLEGGIIQFKYSYFFYTNATNA